ncbi:MAG: hypothetical protein HC905_13855 [Bacteroidales bacterium]|nr:hypothetical protein [Bacteroidales bacterium]
MNQLVNYPKQHLVLLFKKASVLINSSPHTYYFNSFRDVNPLLYQILGIIYNIQLAIILALCSIGFFQVIFNENRLPILYLALFPIVFIFLMIFVEVNDYYSFLTIPSLVFLSTIGIKVIFKTSFTDLKIRISNYKNSVQYISIILFSFIFIYLLSILYVKTSSYSLVDFKKDNFIDKNFNKIQQQKYSDNYGLKGGAINNNEPIRKSRDTQVSYRELLNRLICIY